MTETAHDVGSASPSGDRKTALVTGGSKGIGRAIAKKLLDSGYEVHICARNLAEVEQTVSELRSSGPIHGFRLDLADRKQVFEVCKSWGRPLHALINNAAICKVERIDAHSDDWLDHMGSWDDVIDINLTGQYFLTKGLVRYLPDHGRIVNISSQLGEEARASYGAYCASKFGLIGLTKCWAKELGPRQITVNAICPGWVNTDQAKGDMKRIAAEKGVPAEEYYNEVCAPLEMRRFTEPSEVANLVAFLVSPDGSGVTGRSWLMNTIWNQE